MKLKPYPIYKESDVLWSDSMPTHWDIKQVKYLFSIGRGRVIAETELEDNGVYPVYSSQTQNDGCMGFINTYDFDCEQLTWTTDGANAGTVFIRSGKYNCTNVCGTLQPIQKKDFNLRFYLHTLSFITQFHKRPDTNGAKIMNGEMAAIKLPFPSSLEQEKISSYLDRETAKLDILISKQEKLIELLQEKRQAMISHAVTKGLNPDTKMKDSGIEWLGEVPEHWTVMPLKHAILGIESGTSVNSIDVPAGPGEYGILKTSCVYTGCFDKNENKIVVPEELDRVSCPLKANTLIVSRMNTPELVGAAGLVEETIDCLFLPDRLWQVSFHGADPAFIHYWTMTEFYRYQVKLVCSGTSSSMQNLTQDQFKMFILSEPDLIEQNVISEYLDQETRKIDSLIEKAKRSIALAKEHLTALISAAVTGKIDVREQI